MKRNYFLKTAIVLCFALFAISCIDEHGRQDADTYKPDVGADGAVVNSGILVFSSSEALSATVNNLTENDSFDIKLVPMTRSGSTDFTSLRQHLIDQGLREFSDTELAEIVANKLTYEPEDDLIIDPYLATVLNQDREVQVGNSIYRYVDCGVIKYDASLAGSVDNSIIDNINTDGLSHGTQIPVTSNIDFIKINYIQHIYARDNLVVVDNGSGLTIKTDTWIEYEDDGGITLGNGVKVPKENIKRTTYVQGNGDGNWLQRTISGWFGTNITLENNFDSKHRMKLSMYDQDYILYRAVGMTVRMQKKTFGIWWRKEAEEFRYGWTAIECEYSFKSSPFYEPPKMPNGVPQYDKYPFAMTKNYPYENSKIPLFHIPYANYDFKTGDVNKLMQKGINLLLNKINAWYRSSQGTPYKDSPRGIYTSYENDQKVSVVFPSGEEIAYNEGREKVRWEMMWFSGTFMVGFTSNLTGGGFIPSSLTVSSPTTVEINRGRVYGAVKYNGEWRICVIETGDKA